MSALHIIMAGAIIVVSLILILLVMAQKSREEGLGSSFGDVGGGFEGTRGSSSEMIMRKWTKIVAIAFAVLAIGANVAMYVLK